MSIGENMKIQISLKENRHHPFWLLGNDPKRLKVQLSVHNRGPVELDFSDLHEFEQKQVLNSINAGIIEVDRAYGDLYQVFLQAQTPAPPSDPNSPASRAQELLRAQAQERLKKRADYEEKEKKFLEKCHFLAKQNIRALKASTRESDDLKLFRTLRKLEEERSKPRSSITEYLNERIKTLQTSLVIQADQVAPVKSPGQGTNPYDQRVVNLDREVVHFTQKQIHDLMEIEEVDYTDEDLSQFIS
jgi:hypothetical protein